MLAPSFFISSDLESNPTASACFEVSTLLEERQSQEFTILLLGGILVILSVRRIEVIVGRPIRSYAQETWASLIASRGRLRCCGGVEWRPSAAWNVVFRVQELSFKFACRFLTRNYRFCWIFSHVNQSIIQVKRNSFRNFCLVMPWSPWHIVGKLVLSFFFLLV